jgi:hypothetical protein
MANFIFLHKGNHTNGGQRAVAEVSEFARSFFATIDTASLTFSDTQDINLALN